MCSLIVLLGCHCRGCTVERGGGGEEEAGWVVTPGYKEIRTRGGFCFWQQPTQSCPEEPRTQLMSSGWPFRKMLLTRTWICSFLYSRFPLFSFSCSLCILPLLKNLALQIFHILFSTSGLNSPRHTSLHVDNRPFVFPVLLWNLTA